MKKNVGFWVKLAWGLVKGKLSKSTEGKPHKTTAKFCIWLVGEFITIKTDNNKDDKQQLKDFLGANKNEIIEGVASTADFAALGVKDEKKRQKIQDIIRILKTEFEQGL